MNEPSSSDLSSIARKLFSGGGWALTVKIGAAVVYLGVNALLARLLSPAELGTYFLAFSIVTLAATVGELGLGRTAVYLVAESMGLGVAARCRKAIRVVIRLGMVGAVLAGAAYLIFGSLAAPSLFNTPALSGITVLLGAWITITVLQRVVTEVFRGFHDIRTAALLGRSSEALLPAAILLVALVPMWFLDAGSLGSATAATVVAALTTVLVSGLLLRHLLQGVGETDAGVRAEDLPTAEPGNVLRVALPLLVTNLTAFALSFQLDLWLLSMFRPQDEVAIYGATARLMFFVAAPLKITNAVVPPIIAQLNAEGDRAVLERVLRGVASLGSIPALGILAVFSIFGADILGLLFGDYYRAGLGILILLSVGEVANVVAGPCGWTLMMTGNHRPMMWISVVMATVSLTAGLLAAFYVGPLGLAAVAAGRQILQNGLVIAAARKLVGVRTYVDVTLRSAWRLVRELG